MLLISQWPTFIPVGPRPEQGTGRGPAPSTGATMAAFSLALVVHQPAFAALTRWWAPDHVRALTIVTLAGGLASTVFAPLTAALADHLSWRETYLVLAAILAAVTIPAHAIALTAPRRYRREPERRSAKPSSHSAP